MEKNENINNNKIETIIVRIDERTKYLVEKIDKIDEKTKDYKETKNDVMWLKKFFFILATATVIGLTGMFFALIKK